MVSITPNMEWFTYLILLSLLSVFKCDKCVLDHRTLEEAWEKKLHDDLQKDYKWYESPNGCNITKVYIKFLMSTFVMDSENDVFSAFGILSVSWTDNRLKWNASDYGGIRETFFSIIDYWMPFVELNNGEDDGYWMNFDQCSMTEFGSLHCKLKAQYSTECATQIRNWPYDIQKCTLEFRIAESQKNVHLLTTGKRFISKYDEVSTSPEFFIIGFHQESNRSAVAQLRITVVLNRYGESLSVMIVLPSILISIITVSSLILDVNDRNRFLMILFSMFCHCFYLLEIGWEIPKKTEEIPTILFFYRSSLIITLLLIVATVVLEKCRNKKSAPYSWVTFVYSAVEDSHGKHFIWPCWKTNIGTPTSEEEDMKHVEVWTRFANIANSACFSISVVVYAIMIPVCVPQQQPYTFEYDNNSVFFAADNY